MAYVLIGLLAFISGCAGVINKLLNLEAKKGLGTWNGTLLNYVESSLIAGVLVLLFGGALWKYEVLIEVPWYFFLGGLFGVISLLLALKGMQKSSMIYATILMLVGQLFAGYVVDSIVSGEFNVFKLIAVGMIIFGVYLDKKYS